MKYVRIRGIGSSKHYSERQRKWRNSFKPPMMEAIKREVKMNKMPSIQVTEAHLRHLFQWTGRRKGGEERRRYTILNVS
ncbi:hypothetical protein C0J52_26606 [Blattella germanica]|nr:hypothetical protein C0J52_26606 [Blattella germanica]